MRFLLILVIILVSLLGRGTSTLANGQLELREQNDNDSLFFSTGGISTTQLPEEEDAEFRRLLIPLNGETGCNAEGIKVPEYVPSNEKFVLLLETGNCSFYQKGIAAQRAGAAGVLVANTVKGIYGDSGHAKVSDVNCDLGIGWLPVNQILDPPYAPAMEDVMPLDCTGDQRCKSGRCLLTDVRDSTTGDVKVCCAWDLWIHMSLTPDEVETHNISHASVSIPMGFLRLEDTERLLRAPELEHNNFEVRMYARDTSLNLSSFVIWLLAVLTVSYASVRAAHEDYKNGLSVCNNDGNTTEEESLEGGNSLPSVRPLRSRKHGNRAPTSPLRPSAVASANKEETGLLSVSYATDNEYGIRGVESGDERSAGGGGGTEDEKSVASEYFWRARGKIVHSAIYEVPPSIASDSSEITPFLALFAILFVSGFLVLLSFVNAYWAITVGYMIGTSFGIHMLFLEGPVLRMVCRIHFAWQSCVGDRYGDIRGNNSRLSIDSQTDDSQVSATAESEISPLIGESVNNKIHGRDIHKNPAITSILRRIFSLVVFANIICFVFAAALPVTWLLCRHTSFGWVLQDILSMVLVTFALTRSELYMPNLAVLTMLLSAAFCYDVFFVFIEPMIFGGTSVMAKAALQHADTSVMSYPEQSSGDGTYCDKYPHDSICHEDLLPIMLIVPSLFTWNTNDMQLLGLGDLMLPGLLLVWAARCDMRIYGTLSSEIAGGGFFPFTLIGYAIGLTCANTASLFFDVGQPALLYIIPCMMLLVLIRALEEGTLRELWLGLPNMRTVAQPVDLDKLEEYRKRKAIVKATAEWPPDEKHEKGVVRLNSDKTSIVPVPWRSVENDVYNRVFDGLRDASLKSSTPAAKNSVK